MNKSNNNKTTSTFETLAVWKEPRNLRNEISKLTKVFPADERYRLTDQMLRSSRSVTANIAEGHGRYHYQENIQFCRQSRGSLYELLDHLTVALDEEYIAKNTFILLKDKVLKVVKILNGYVSYLKKQKKSE